MAETYDFHLWEHKDYWGNGQLVDSWYGDGCDKALRIGVSNKFKNQFTMDVKIGRRINPNEDRQDPQQRRFIALCQILKPFNIEWFD